MTSFASVLWLHRSVMCLRQQCAVQTPAVHVAAALCGVRRHLEIPGHIIRAVFLCKNYFCLLLLLLLSWVVIPPLMSPMAAVDSLSATTADCSR